MLSGLTLIVAIVIGIIVLIVYFNSNTYKISKAKELVQDGKYQQARKILSEIEYDDSMSKDYEEIGDICFKRNSYNDALEIYQKINNKKKIYDTKSKQAEVDIKNEDFDGAISIYEGIGEKEKVNDTLRKKAYKLLETEKYVDAIAIFESLKDKDNIRSSKQKWADSYLRRNEYNMAYKIYKEIKDEAGKTNALVAKAKSLYDQKKYSSALKIYKKVGDKDGVNKTENKLKMVALYKQAKKEYENELYLTALNTVEKIEDYSPAETLKKEIEDEINRLKPDVPNVGEFYDVTESADYGFARVRVDWDEVSPADGYEYYATSNYDITSSNGVLYYAHFTAGIYNPNVRLTFKVRAYREVNGERIYGDWSRVVTVNGNDYLQ